MKLLIVILMLSVRVFAEEDTDLSKFKNEIKHPTSCTPKLDPKKPYKSYLLNCCPPITLKGGGLARIEGEGGIYHIGVYKNKADAKPNIKSKDAQLLESLGSPNQQCQEMKYYADFDIVIIRQNKGQTTGYTEWSIDVVTIEDGKALKPRPFPIMNEEDGESSTLLSPEVSVQGENLVLSLTNRLSSQPVVRSEILNAKFKE